MPFIHMYYSFAWVSEWVEKVRQQQGWWGKVGAGKDVGVWRSGEQGCRENRSLVGQVKDEGREERGHPILAENGNDDKREVNEGQTDEGESWAGGVSVTSSGKIG